MKFQEAEIYHSLIIFVALIINKFFVEMISFPSSHVCLVGFPSLDRFSAFQLS